MVLGTHRVLAVDDETNMRDMLERRLTRGGYKCVTAASAEEASQILQKEQFDLLLLDILMPDKSGMELLPEVVARYPDMAVVMMTAVVDTATAITAMREGASDYVTKPINLDQLATRLTRALDRQAGVLRNREYQQNLEKMLAERTERIEQRMREVTALNNLVQGHIQQSMGAEEAYAQLQTALAAFSNQLGDLAEQARVIGDQGSGAPWDLSSASLEEGHNP